VRLIMKILYPTWLPVGGITLCPGLILINAKYKADVALHRHEETHVYQMQRVGTLTFWWRYLTNKAFRMAVEVEAYRVQIANGATVNGCAIHLASGYRLGITVDDALRALEAKA
jgi:hypothetical protein